MADLFPEDIRIALLKSEDPDLKIPPEAFARFDYYAQFITSLSLWHHGREGYIARILTRSRPGIWIFPSLRELHLGATAEELETVPIYLTPELRSLWLNHWDGEGGREIQPREDLKKTLIQVCRLRELQTLDMADTLYTPLETDSEIVEGFARLASQLTDFRSLSFLTLPPVFEPLSLNAKLHSVLINTANVRSNAIPLNDIVRNLRERFTGLSTLAFYCSMEQAITIFSELRRAIPHINVKISTAMEARDLYTVISSIFSAITSIRSLRISSGGNLFSDQDPPIRISEVLRPLQACRQLRRLEIIITFGGDQMMRDDEIAQYFRAWPDLNVCTILNDAEGDLVALEGEETSFGLTLAALVFAARYCRHLKELSLPFVDASVIPPITDVEKVQHTLTLQFSSTHIHDFGLVRDFIARLWLGADISFSGCDHNEATRITV